MKNVNNIKDKKLKLMIGAIEYYLNLELSLSLPEKFRVGYKDIKKYDFVVEISSLRANPHWGSFGFYVGKNSDGSETIERLTDGKFVKWQNCSFYKLPREFTNYLLYKGVPANIKF